MKINIPEDTLHNLLLQAVQACFIEDTRSHTPILSTMKKICLDISALIPNEKQRELVEYQQDIGESPFSRGVAEVLSWLRLLNSQIPSPPPNEDIHQFQNGLLGSISMCELTLYRQVKHDRKSKRVTETV